MTTLPERTHIGKRRRKRCGTDEARDAHQPDEQRAQGDAVQVTLGDTGGASRRGDAATEHVRQTATLSLVHEDGQGQQDAGQEDQHDQDVVQNGHGQSSFYRSSPRIGAHIPLV